MAIAFKKATKKGAFLRAAIFGPSGAGKTYSALSIAQGMSGDSVAVIDTERGSASKYADRFGFDVLDLADRSIEGYVEAINAAHGYTVLIIDSMSHGWQELIQDVERIAKAKYRGNTWSAWSEGTPKQRMLVDALLDFPGHIIATMRVATEWTTETDSRGKGRPVRVGLKPEQGKGIEYEFDLLLELSPEHIANVIKDRTGKWQDELIEKPGVEFGKQLVAWLVEEGEPELPPKPQPSGPRVHPDLAQLIEAKGINEDTQAKWCAHFGVESVAHLSEQQVASIVDAANKKAEG